MPDVTSFISDPEVALLIISTFVAIAALVKPLVVPKSLYDKSEARADKATEALANMASAVGELTEEIRRGR